MSRPGASVTTVSQDKQRIPFKDKRKKTSKILIKGNETIQEPDTQVKGKNSIVYLMKKSIIKKRLHHLKIRKTTLVVLRRRHVNPVILQVKLIVVQ